MRWFIVFLIVANVILFFWAQQQSSPLPGAASLPPPDVGRLRLLSELEEEPVSVDVDEPEGRAEDMLMAPPLAAVPEVQSPSAHAEEALQSSLDVGDYRTSMQISFPESESITDVPPVDVTSFITEVDPAIGAETEDLAVEKSTGVDEVAEVLALDAPPGIDEPVDQTLEESVEKPVQEPDVSVPEPAVEAAIVEPAPAGPAQSVCARVGPFEADDADKLISGLPAHVTLLSDVAEEYAIVDRYYVLIPQLPSRAEGYQKLKELADAGITDTWLFPSGEYRNAISLGFFSKAAGAKRHAANVAGKGFNTEVKEKTSVRERRWLLLMSNDGRDPGPSLSLPAGVAAEQHACP